VGGTIGEVVPLALAIAASPFPIIPAILFLFTPRARATSIGFLIGWMIGIITVTVAFAALASVIDPGDETPTWASWARIGLGVLLVVLGVRQWRQKNEKSATPAWMQSIEDATPGQALRLGLLLSAANPKIVLLAAASGLAIGSADLTTAGVVGAVAMFTAVAASTVALPLLLHAFLGDRMLGPLGRAKDWLKANNAVVMAWVLMVIGVALSANGVGGL
jgi:threonine/homoserine/homoserine lactone efflux protein